jgi:peptide/nickel transport system permease protein
MSAMASPALAKLSRPAALVGIAIVVAFVVLAVFAPWLAPYDPVASDWSAFRQPPSAEHWFGTDEIGRDVASRVIWGARASLIAGVMSVVIAIAIGVPFGLAAGYAGKAIDATIMRVTDGLLAIPSLVLAIALAGFLGAGLANATIAIGLSAMPVFIRLTRAQVLAVRGELYVDAARALGYSNRRIVLRHILPNILPALLVQATVTMAIAIIAEAGLSFLGLGLQPPEPSWGASLNAARNFIAEGPWMSFWPGLFICVAVFGFNLTGDALRDAFDPQE